MSSVHKGISRVLQGFEVVMLSILTHAVTGFGGIPVSLAHDGEIVYFKEEVDPTEMYKKVSEEIASWSMFLLKGKKIAIEPKTCIANGKHILESSAE